MGLTTQVGNLVWQKAKNALTAANANPAEQRAFIDALKPFIAEQKRNPDLAFIPFSAEQVVTNTGFQAVDVACTLYGIWAKGRRTTGTTSSFLAVHAAADNAATTTTVLTTRFKATGQACAYVNGAGLAVETALTLSAATAVGGATESSAADAADGFIIVGA